MYYAEIIDNTSADYFLPKIHTENKDNIIGLYIDALKGKENKIDIEALYLGLDALLNEGSK